MTYRARWDLDSCFEKKLTEHEIEELCMRFKDEILQFQKIFSEKSAQINHKKCILSLQHFDEKAKHLSSYFLCRASQDVRDERAQHMKAEIQKIEAVLKTLAERYFSKLAKTSDLEFELLMQDPELSEISYPIREKRRDTFEKMSDDKEALVNSFAIDGLYGWQELYDIMMGNMTIPLCDKGKTEFLSYGQADNMLAAPERKTRHAVYRGIQEVCKQQEQLFAQTLNHISGFRLELYAARSWDSVLKTPLNKNRMDEKILEALWAAVEEEKEPFAAFLDQKAAILGEEKISWYDLEAPIGNDTKTITFEQGSQIVIEQFERFCPSLALFAKNALLSGWVEAENKPFKAPGGYCTPFPMVKESRIFMTYSGTYNNVLVLAHELGHAFHSHVLADFPFYIQEYPMSLAETASTIAELFVLDGLLEKCTTLQEKKVILHNKAQRSCMFFLNIHARFIFEKSFYKERKKGQVSSKRLCELMEDAQKKAYLNKLEEYNPYFWITKLHFYQIDWPFYNFPYTFGYLLSLSIYAKAKKNPKWFSTWYRNFLEDTGRMACHELCQKHFGKDISQKKFWKDAIQVAASDARQFIEITKQEQ